MDERQLIRSARNGNLQDFNRLVMKYQDLVYRQAFYMLPDPTQAEEVALETFVHAYHHLPTFHNGTYKIWLLRITTRHCLNQPGIQRLRKPTEPLHPMGQSTRAEAAHTSPDQKAHSNAHPAGLHHLLHQELQALPPLDRAAIVLTEVQSLSSAEATEVLQISENRFKAYLVQARKQLCLSLNRAAMSCPAAGMA